MTKKTRYSEVIPKTKDWPIVQFSRNRKDFIRKVITDSYQNIKLYHWDKLREELEMTIYREKVRIKTNPWKIDPKDEKQYWKQLQKKLIQIDSQHDAEEKVLDEILKEIIDRYANEIAGNFKKTSYQFARRVVTFGFARLLNAARVKGFASLFSRQLDLDDKIHITGEKDHIRNLAKKGTLVMVPTHFSNLDSILIGWVIQFLGLPPFIYGAGLNLFNIKIIAYFMNSLGAYKVDRRKKNPIYLETLKAYSRMSIENGFHSLFFPGGTRSRSGRIEKNIKKGLLSTVIEAQRTIYQKNLQRKVFLVPVVINYHFTLEAPVLINEFLKKEGQERYYVENDEYSNSYKIATFLFKFFTKGSDISVSIGKGMDVLGNYVDDNGNSFDHQGNPVDTKDYFIYDGLVNIDHQREHEYNRILAQRVVEEYHKYNRVFSSHLVAFTAFEYLRTNNDKLDLYSLLRIPAEDLVIDYEDFKAYFDSLREEVFELNLKNKVKVATHMKKPLDEVIGHGLKNLGMYHAKRPLIKKNGKIIIQDMNTLYYYHNRMEGYGLEKVIAA